MGSQLQTRNLNLLDSRTRRVLTGIQPTNRLSVARPQRCTNAVPAGRLGRTIVSSELRTSGRVRQVEAAKDTARAIWEAAARAVFCAGAAACVTFSSITPGLADEILRFPASTDPAIFAAQKTLVEAWTIVNDAYVDGNFNGRDWERELSQALTAAYQSEDGEKAYGEITKLLEKLGDPFTRIVPPQEYADFRVSSDGEVQGVGLLIASDPDSGKLIVLAPIRGGPADRAGVQAGDLVVSIDGKATDGWDGERAAKFLRGKSGSSVSVRFARRTEQVPGVPGRPEDIPKVEYNQVLLRRERVELSPVFSAAVAHSGHLFGYIRLVNFSQHAAQDMKKAISELEGQGVDGYILDLRNNPGGLVKAGLDVARLWLKGSAPVFNVAGRSDFGDDGALVQHIILDDSPPATDKPLAVLINENSASASEILAGALHDNARAELIGRTSYGKGKIQSVFELADGSALFVTVAKYKTPSMQEIDKVGINPDLSCTGLPTGSSSAEASPSLPMPSVSGFTLLGRLENDSCILTAESLLEGKQGDEFGTLVAPIIADMLAK